MSNIFLRLSHPKKISVIVTFPESSIFRLCGLYELAVFYSLSISTLNKKSFAMLEDTGMLSCLCNSAVEHHRNFRI